MLTQEPAIEDQQESWSATPLMSTTSTSPDQRLLGRLVFFTGLIVVAILVAFCFLASSLCITVTLSAFLAILVDSGVTRLEKIGVGRALSAGAIVLVTMLFIGLLAVGCYKGTRSFADQLPEYSRRLQQALSPIVQKVENLEQSTESLSSGEASQTVPEIQVKDAPAWPGFLIRGVGTISGALVVAGVVPFLTFFMLVRKSQMATRFVAIFDGRIDSARFMVALREMVRGYVIGNLLVGSILAGTTTLLFLALGMKGAIVLGILAGILNLVPFLGVLLAEGVSLSAALLQFDSIAPFIVIALAVLILHIVAANLLIPQLIGCRVLIGPVAATVGLLFWGWLWGIMGLLLAVPLTAFIKLVADSHSSLSHLSNMLAYDPRPIPRWMRVGQQTMQRVAFRRVHE